MTCKINCKRMLLGGVFAGVWIYLIEAVVHGPILMNRYQELQKMGFFYPEPQLPFFAVDPLLCFAVGVMLAWFYAAARDTLGAGPKTAIKLGFVLAFVTAIPSGFAEASWHLTGKFLPFARTVGIFVEYTIGALIAGLVYRPQSEGAECKS